MGGKASVENAVARASKYYAHPSFTTEFDIDVQDWAKKHPGEIRKASDPRAALRRAREHHHGGQGRDHDHHLPKQLEAAWTFWTEHYAALAGRQDMSVALQQEWLA